MKQKQTEPEPKREKQIILFCLIVVWLKKKSAHLGQSWKEKIHAEANGLNLTEPPSQWEPPVQEICRDGSCSKGSHYAKGGRKDGSIKQTKGNLQESQKEPHYQADGSHTTPKLSIKKASNEASYSWARLLSCQGAEPGHQATEEKRGLWRPLPTCQRDCLLILQVDQAVESWMYNYCCLNKKCRPIHIWACSQLHQQELQQWWDHSELKWKNQSNCRLIFSHPMEQLFDLAPNQCGSSRRCGM